MQPSFLRFPRRRLPVAAVLMAVAWTLAGAAPASAPAEPAADAPPAAASAAQDEHYVDFFRWIDVDNDRGISQLLKKGFDPNTRDPKGQAALFVALRAKSLKVARLLWEAPGIQIDARNGADETPLMMAAMRGEADAVQALLAHGAAPVKDGWSPLHYAATGGSAEVVRILLAHGAPIEARSPNGSTPLMMAAKYASEEAVDALLAAGASRGAKNDLGMDAAAFAASAGRDRLAARLKADAGAH
jgi:ankyrin repeat protein